MNAAQVHELEVELLLDALSRRYGYHYQEYSGGSLGRRIGSFLQQQNCSSPTALLPSILHDQTLFWEFVSHISVPYTEFFRDPTFFLTLREQVIPHLRTFPFLNVWIAGCATGEEPYSLAVLLYEEGLLERTHIYCTDVNPSVLANTQAGAYRMEKIHGAAANYEQAGGKKKWLEYFTQDGTQGIIQSEFRKALTISKHNLNGDGVFGDMNLILCRNVLIYFNQELQHQVGSLFVKSLVRQGFLCIGQNEYLQSTSLWHRFEQPVPTINVFRLRS